MITPTTRKDPTCTSGTHFHRYLGMRGVRSGQLLVAKHSLPALRALVVLYSNVGDVKELRKHFDKSLLLMATKREKFQTVKSDIFVHGIRGLSGDVRTSTQDIAALEPTMASLCTNHYHSSVSEEFVRCFAFRDEATLMCKHLGLIEDKWPGRLRTLLGQGTIDLVRGCAERAEELPSWARPLLLQVLSPAANDARYPAEEGRMKGERGPG